MLKRLFTLGFAVMLCLPLTSQILTTDPAFPSAGAPVTIFFDATQGTAGLANCNCDVYLHTGVITSASTGPSDWKYVVTTWGQANAAWKMTPVPGQPNRYSYVIGPSIRQYYNVPAGEEILQMAFVFRNANGSKEGKDTGNKDIFYDVYPENLALTTSLLSPGADALEVALGQEIEVKGQASKPSTLTLYDNGELLDQQTNATSLGFTIYADEPGSHTVMFIAESGTEKDTSTFTYQAELRAAFLSPAQQVLLVSPGSQLNVKGTAYIPATLRLLDNGAEIAMLENATEINQSFIIDGNTHQIDLVAEYQGQVVRTSFVYLTPASLPKEDPPAGFEDGITFIGDTSVFLQLYAPGKQTVFVLGDFNGWQARTAYLMKKGNDNGTFWIQIDGLEPGRNYTFQYLVGSNIRVADPLSTVVLDPDHDRFIPEETYPDLPPYPAGKGQGIVSLIQPGAPAYEWQVDDFQAPPREELIVYELLLRDFISRHDYTTLIDTLDYLQRLGINAIELMPVNEFEGNISWGYNPSFHMALDKYYGPINEFKRFIDDCHARGIAVILDVVYNHAFSQSPLAQMYWDPGNFRPAPGNPWLNPTARHPFNVGYDFNHESEATRRYVDRVMKYWLSEFRVDGFRFDLSKGFSQRFTTDVGFWGSYDASRIAILKHYADVMWTVNPNAYAILEHFADNSEETELVNYGMMSWAGAGLHNQYLDAAIGFSGNLTGAAYTSRGWTVPHLIAYIESHDEERMVYKNRQFGNSNGNYNVRDWPVALRRAELANAFFYTIPGPKMLWQFGELGYDYSINTCDDGVTISNDCRLSLKPIRWDYYQDPERRRLFEVTRALMRLKTEYEVFNTANFSLNLAGTTKTVFLDGEDMDVAVQGNFGVIPADIQQPFPQGGWWYDYFKGDSILVQNPASPLTFAPGEYHVYTSVRLTPPGGFLTPAVELVKDHFRLRVSPNPAAGPLNISYTLPAAGRVRLELFDLSGRPVALLANERRPSGEQQHQWQPAQPAGTYLLQLRAADKVETQLLIIGQ